MRRMFVPSALVAAICILTPATGYAQQSFNMFLGGFTPRAEDGRTSGDVLVNNLDFLAFNLNDFSGGVLGAEWEFPLSDRVHASLGMGFTKKTVSSVYADFYEDDFTEIEQKMRLRVVPLTALVRFNPLGQDAPIQPYIGAGVGVFAWRYSESGEFIDFRDGTVFREKFVGSGATAGPVILGGLVFPLGAWALGGELRYQSAQGELPQGQGFAGTKIDLGGMSYLASLKVRF